MESQSHFEVTVKPLMLPPSPGTFQDREDLIRYVRDFGASQGYVVTIKKSRRDRRVILGCDRGGVYRNRRKIEESKRKRKASSRLINCPFEAIGKKEDDVWVLYIKNGEHNHDALKDMSEHPYSRRFTEEEVRQIKLMTDAGIKPSQVLKALKQNNPELQSTPRHLYNLKAKIRQGNFSEKSFKSWRPNRSASASTSAETFARNFFPMKVPNLIGGKFVESQSCSVIDVVNPATQQVVSQVPLATYEEFKAAVSAAKEAYPSWRNTPVTTRQRIMFKLQELIRRDIDKLTMNIAIEQGKTLSGARGDVLRGLEVVEHACGMATLQMGEFVPNASNGIDTYCTREPLGVCAGLCPFNFPAMICLWMFPIAITCGNTFILKPSEINPGAAMILAALAIEAGLPDGVLNIVHGTHEIVNHICDDCDIKAISFVGSDTAGMHTYARAAARGKRVQSNMGAKNHAIIMPDASADATLDALVAAGFGAAGQRCMTLSTAVFVGGSAPWEEELVERAKALKVNAGTEQGADLGPVISKEEKERICRLVQTGVESGARLVLDGRNITVPRYEHGNFVAPTILCDVTTDMDCYNEEMFGPVLLCMKVDSLEEAISVVNRNTNGNGATIFTTSGAAARQFQTEVEAGLVGINVAVPIPLPFSSFNGSKASFAGDLNFSGKAGVQFYTQIKTVAQQWRDLPTRRMAMSYPPSFDMEASSRGSLQHPPTSESELPSRETSSVFPSVSGKASNTSEPLSSSSDGDLQTEESDSDEDTPTIRDSETLQILKHLATGNDRTDILAASNTSGTVNLHQAIPSTFPEIQNSPVDENEGCDAFPRAVATSERVPNHLSSQKNDSGHSGSLRADFDTLPITRRLNAGVDLFSQKRDKNLRPPDRVCRPTVSTALQNVGQTSQRTERTSANLETTQMSTPSVSLTGPTIYPASEKGYMSAAPSAINVVPSQLSNVMPPTPPVHIPCESQGRKFLSFTSENLYFPLGSSKYMHSSGKTTDGSLGKDTSDA